VDLYKTIQTLNDERERLDKLIASLELLKAAKKAVPRQKKPVHRGRKGMNAAERKETSDRMKKYWAARRAASAEPKAATPSPGKAATPSPGKAATASADKAATPSPDAAGA
jgi:peptidoglycan hydrolase CwlO-like protein